MSDTKNTAILYDGQNCLADGDYAEAARLFAEALKQDPADTAAHEGALLAHYQCRTMEELAALGVCFMQKGDYRAARESADADTLARYDAAERDALWYAHVHTIRALRQPIAVRRLSLRAEGYDAFPAHDEELSAIHAILVKNIASAKKGADYCGALLSLLDRYATDACSALPQVQELTAIVSAAYKAATDALLTRLEDAICPKPFTPPAPPASKLRPTNNLTKEQRDIAYQVTMENMIRNLNNSKPVGRIVRPQTPEEETAELLGIAAQWAEPVAGRQTHLGADGGPDTVAARYLYLAEKLTPTDFYDKEKPAKLSVAIEVLFGCCDRAEAAGAHPSLCREQRQALVTGLLTPELPAAERERLCNVCRDDARPCLAILRDRITPCTARNPSEHLIFSVLKGGEKVYARYANDLTAIDQWIEQQRGVVAAYDSHAENLKSEAEPMLRNLVADAAADARMTFDEYLHALNQKELPDATAARNQLEQLENLRPSLEAHFADREKRRYRLAVIGDVVRPLISLLCALAAAGAAYTAWLNLQHPERVASYPVLLYSIIAVVICIVGGVLLALIIGWQGYSLDQKYHKHRFPKIVNDLSLVLLFAAIIAAIVMFVMYGLRYSKGTDEPTTENSAVSVVETEKEE